MLETCSNLFHISAVLEESLKQQVISTEDRKCVNVCGVCSSSHFITVALQNFGLLSLLCVVKKQTAVCSKEGDEKRLQIFFFLLLPNILAVIHVVTTIDIANRSSYINITEIELQLVVDPQSIEAHVVQDDTIFLYHNAEKVCKIWI